MTARAIWYVAHPLGGDVEGNAARAMEWLTWLMLSEPDATFIAPWLHNVAVFVKTWPGEDDRDHPFRARSMLDSLAMVARCDGIILCGGRITGGMRAELDAAGIAGNWVLDLNHLGPEPPSAPHRLPEAYRMPLPRNR